MLRYRHAYALKESLLVLKAAAKSSLRQCCVSYKGLLNPLHLQFF